MSKLQFQLIKPLLSKESFHLRSEGDSMRPMLLAGDIIYFKKMPFKKIESGDVVLARIKSDLFIHRVVFKNPKFLITKGDNNLFIDGKVYSKNYLALVYGIKRDNRLINIETAYFLQSATYMTEILKVKEALEEAKINFLFLKGLPLYLFFTKRHPKRIYSDCDLLIDKGEYQKVKKILTSLGYEQSVHSPSSKLKDSGPEITFVKNTKGLPVTLDIHLEAVFMMMQLGRLEFLYQQKKIDQLSKQLLENKRFISINGQVFPILSSEYLIFYLLLHLFHHNFNGSYRYDLIAKILKKERVDWELFGNIVKSYKLEGFVYPTMLLLKKYYQTKLPKIVLGNITSFEREYKKLVKMVLKEDIFSDDSRLEAGVKRFFYLFLLSPSPIFIKILTFLNPQVIYLIFRTIFKVLRAQVYFFWASKPFKLKAE